MKAQVVISPLAEHKVVAHTHNRLQQPIMKEESRPASSSSPSSSFFCFSIIAAAVAVVEWRAITSTMLSSLFPQLCLKLQLLHRYTGIVVQATCDQHTRSFIAQESTIRIDPAPQKLFLCSKHR
jgi:hypothetical protein